MSKKLVETIYGKRSKYEVFRSSSVLGGTDFSIHKDGALWKTGIKDLSYAIKKIRENG